MVKRLNANEIIELLNSSDAEALDDVTFEGDIELEIDDTGSFSVNQLVAYALGEEAARIGMRLLSLAQSIGYPVEKLVDSQAEEPMKTVTHSSP